MGKDRIPKAPKPRNPFVVPARIRSGGGFHKDKRERRTSGEPDLETAECVFCGDPVDPEVAYCSGCRSYICAGCDDKNGMMDGVEKAEKHDLWEHREL